MTSIGQFIGEDLGTITAEGCDPLTGAPVEGTVTYHFYTCAHCSNSIIIDSERARPRVRCQRCFRVICEKKPICRSACTPLNELANDNFQAPERWRQFVPAIMAGVEDVNQAHEKGLILIPGSPGVEVI